MVWQKVQIQYRKAGDRLPVAHRFLSEQQHQVLHTNDLFYCDDRCLFRCLVFFNHMHAFWLLPLVFVHIPCSLISLNLIFVITITRPD